jgi:hypothetical protein
MTRNEFIIATVNPLDPTSGLAQYNTSQISRVVIANGINNLRAIPQGATPDKGNATSILGNPVLCDLKILGKSYTGLDGKKYTIPDITMETVIVSVSQTKNIIATPITGRDGTVKEYIALGDYMVSISGILTAANGQYPEESIAALAMAKKAPVSLEVVNKLLQLYDIDNMVIADYSIPQEPGKYSTQVVNIQAWSDNPFIINL